MKTLILAAVLVPFAQSAFAAAWELHRQAPNDPGGYVLISTHSTSGECSKAMGQAKKGDPAGNYGCYPRQLGPK